MNLSTKKHVFLKEEILEFVSYKNKTLQSGESIVNFIHPLQHKWAHKVGMIYNNEYGIYIRIFYRSKSDDSVNGLNYIDYKEGEFISWKRNKVIEKILKIK